MSGAHGRLPDETHSPDAEEAPDPSPPKRTVTINAYNRPDYLARTLRSLSRNNLAGYEIHVGIEPGCPAVVTACEGFGACPIHITVNERQLGVDRNALATIRRAMESGSTGNVHTEEDVIFSRDALDMANWFFEAEECRAHECLHLHNSYLTGLNNRRKPGIVYCVGLRKRRGQFSHLFPGGYGICITPDKWEQRFREWWAAGREGGTLWDIRIRNGLKKIPGSTILIPAFSRSRHIGKEGGIHSGREGWEHLRLHYHQRGRPRRYRIVPEPSIDGAIIWRFG